VARGIGSTDDGIAIRSGEEGDRIGGEVAIVLAEAWDHEAMSQVRAMGYASLLNGTDHSMN
jgi:hypothetical protein